MPENVPIKKVTKGGHDYTPGIEPIQKGFKVTKSDLYSDSTGRSAETGALIQYLIRSNIYSIELQYSGTVAQIADIEALYTGTSFTVEFFDNGSYISKTMYPSDRVKDTESLKSIGRVNFSVTLVEL